MISTITPQGVVMGDGTNFTLTEAQGFESPDVQVSSYQRSGRHGIIVNRALWRARRLRLTFKLRASTIAAYAELRNQFLNAWNLPQADDIVTIPFTTTDGRQLQFDAQLVNALDGGFLPGYVTAGKIRVELLAPNVNFESQSAQNASVYLPVTSGVSLPHALPVGFGKTGGQTIIENSGNGNVFPVIRVYGPVTNFHLKHEGLNIDFGLSYALASSSYVEIDMKEETVLLNGTGSLLANMSGNFWYLIPGSNTLTFSADTYDASSYAYVTYRNGYTGI